MKMIKLSKKKINLLHEIVRSNNPSLISYPDAKTTKEMEAEGLLTTLAHFYFGIIYEPTELGKQISKNFTK